MQMNGNNMSTSNKKPFYLSHYGALALRIALVLAFYTISRTIFFTFNTGYFIVPEDDANISYLFKVFLGGMRFDLSAIFYINMLYILCCILPFTFRNADLYKKTTGFLFYYLTNIVAFAFDYIDVVYFRFTEKRMTFDIFHFAQVEGGFLRLIPAFLRDYWCLFLLFVVMTALFIWMASRIQARFKSYLVFSWRWFFKNLFYVPLTVGVLLLGIRGGVQGYPITLAMAAQYAKTGNDAFVLNTPFSVITTIFKANVVRPVRYFDDQTLKTIYTPVRQYDTDTAFRNKNVVIVILEGFSAEHSQFFNPKAQTSYMPYIDKLAREGSALPSYANGLRSMEAIPAIISGIPTLMRNEYLTSNYAGNNISGLPAVLKTKGYTSAFFHGGNNGTLKLDSYASLAGFDYYYGANEYGDKKDHDGSWGIYDEPFLQYALQQMDTLHPPFFAALFTLSSHHPYNIPAEYKKTLHDPKQETGILESILYADHSLKKFMEEAEKYSWFNNTLFVFVPDHTSSPTQPFSRLQRYEIFSIYYAPTDSLPTFQIPFSQQIDIMPSVLHLLNYSKPFFSFGNSVFHKHKPFAINYNRETYQFITEQKVFIFDGDTVTASHNRKTRLIKNLLGKEKIPQEDYDFMRAMIQTYNTALIENRLTLKRYDAQ